MYQYILDKRIGVQDWGLSVSSLEHLRQMVAGRDRSLVFFVGAGASAAGNTGISSTSDLLRELLRAALARTGSINVEDRTTDRSLGAAAPRLWFEITLNDLWQICGEAIVRFFSSFKAMEAACAPNRVHAFLAHRLCTGGVVLTTK